MIEILIMKKACFKIALLDQVFESGEGVSIEPGCLRIGNGEGFMDSE